MRQLLLFTWQATEPHSLTLNCSPMQYLQTARLQALRADLQARSHPGGVSDLMLKYQFNHFGRCSQLYYRQFGEYPSETRWD